ncbi:MAG: hypothetical protein EXS36_04950 [Pedosphaera sp.]|nr:hypothetical protein [Pedosphaera sp.]
MEFYAGSILLKSVSPLPYRFDWSDMGIGDYSLTARAIDNQGRVFIFDSIRIAVSHTCGEVAIVHNLEDPEIRRLQDYLFEMGLSSSVFVRGTVSFDILRRFNLIVWHNRTEGSPFLRVGDVEMLERLGASSIPVYFAGESLPSAASQLPSLAKERWSHLTRLSSEDVDSGVGLDFDFPNVIERHSFFHGAYGKLDPFHYSGPIEVAASSTGDSAGVVIEVDNAGIPELTIQRVLGGDETLEISNAPVHPGLRYQLQENANLKDWTNVREFTATAESYISKESIGTAVSRYFRVSMVR